MKTRNPIQLQTTSIGLSFELDPVGGYYPEQGPCIIVFDGNFEVGCYSLQMLESMGGGVCITSGEFEKYRAIEAHDLARLCAEARTILEGAK